MVTSHLGLWWVWAESLTQTQWSTGGEREKERDVVQTHANELCASDLPRTSWTLPSPNQTKGRSYFLVLAAPRAERLKSLQDRHFFIFLRRWGQQTNPYKSYQGCVRKRGHTWRRLVPSFGPFLDFRTSDNVGGGWRVGAGTDRPPIRDTQSIATFTIVFFEPLKSDKVLIKAKSTEVRLLVSCDAFQCTHGDPALTNSPSIKSFICLFIYLPWNCPWKTVLILKRKKGKLSDPFRVSVNPKPCKQVQPVDSDFRCNSDTNTTRYFTSFAKRQRTYGGGDGCHSKTRFVLTDEMMTAFWTGTRHITENRERVIYLFLDCGALWQATTCVCAAYT